MFVRWLQAHRVARAFATMAAQAVSLSVQTELLGDRRWR